MQDPHFELDFQLEAYQNFQMALRHLVDFYDAFTQSIRQKLDAKLAVTRWNLDSE